MEMGYLKYDRFALGLTALSSSALSDTRILIQSDMRRKHITLLKKKEKETSTRNSSETMKHCHNYRASQHCAKAR